jgi:mono/diheme cytochrome c family protein
MLARQIPLRLAPLALTVAVMCALCTPRTAAADVPKTPQVARGEHIARLVCSACHVVAIDQEFPPLLKQPTPAFAEIADRPGVTAESLQRFITTTHWDVDKLPMSMPNPMLTRSEAQAVSLYILSLRKH